MSRTRTDLQGASACKAGATHMLMLGTTSRAEGFTACCMCPKRRRPCLSLLCTCGQELSKCVL